MPGIANGTLAPPAQTPQPVKSAHRMMQRQPDGSLKSVLIDDNTGQPVDNPAGYNVTDGFFSDLSSLGLNPTNGVGASPQTGANMPQQSTAQQVIKPTGGEGGDRGSSSDRAGTRAAARDASNNYGFIDKPTAVSVAGMLPGAIGLAGKAVNAGINANNLAATNAARTELGLPDTTGMAAAKSVISDNKGQVANVGIGNQNYSVGLTAMSPTGLTNMTPDEARMHSLLNQQPVNELTPAQVAAQQASFNAANNPNAGPFTGVFGGILNGAKNFVDNLFSSPQSTSFPDAPPSPMTDNSNHYGGGFQGTSSGSDGNNSGTTTGNNANTNGQGTSSAGAIGRSEGDGNFGGGMGGGRGLSPGASGAIDHGEGGLY